MRLRNSLIAAFVLVLLIGCQKDEPLPQHQTSTTQASTTAVETATAPVTNTVATTQTSAPGPAGGAALASTDGEYPGVTINVTELKRTSGGTVNLKFTVVNSSDKDMDWGYNFTDGDYNTISGVHLIDPVGKKKYFVVRDAEGKCVCSSGMASVKPGTQMNVWAKFPSPPSDVPRVTVVIPHFTPMDDVPIS